MAARQCLTAILLAAVGHQTASLNLRHSTDKAVCVSLVAFEETEYVEALIENFLFFSEPTTKLAIHLNSGQEYNGTEKSWASHRVALTKERIAVHKFRGSVLYAHLLNVDTMARTWPGTCEYYVIQASNMMWVRSGMEQYVRKYEFSPLGSSVNVISNCAWNKEVENSRTFVGFSSKLNAIKKVYGYGQPEGSFFPFAAVKRFKVMMDRHLREVHDDGSGIYNASCYFENAWLQTYVLNYEHVPEGPENDQMRENITHLSLNKLDGPFAISEVRAVMDGQGDYKGYFAIKRVERNVREQPTKFIISLAK